MVIEDVEVVRISQDFRTCVAAPDHHRRRADRGGHVMDPSVSRHDEPSALDPRGKLMEGLALNRDRSRQYSLPPHRDLYESSRQPI